MRKFSNLLVAALLATLAAPVIVRSQNAFAQIGSSSGDSQAAKNSVPISTSGVTTQSLASSLANLPEAETLIYINPQRILNEVVPKFMPPKDVEEMKKGFEQAKAFANVDPTKVAYIVITTRSRKRTADLNFQLPEFLVVASGGFDAESLVVLARMASQGKLRDEKYGTKTLGLMTIDPIVKQAEKNPLLKSFAEMGIVALSANTIAAGSPSYLRAAIDAGDGKERISSETLNSLVRDPNVLISIAGTPWHSFAKSFGMLGTEANARTPRCESKIGDFYAALTMDATNFMLRGAMNADNPDTAKIMSNLISMFVGQATNAIKDPSAQALLKGFGIAAEGDDVTLRADVPQQMLIDLLHKPAPPKPMEVTAPKAPVKPVVKRRRTRRRA